MKDLGKYSKENNVIITGIHLEREENVSKIIKTLAEELNIELYDFHINIARRSSTFKRNSKIIVKLRDNKKKRDYIILIIRLNTRIYKKKKKMFDRLEINGKIENVYEYSVAYIKIDKKKKKRNFPNRNRSETRRPIIINLVLEEIFRGIKCKNRDLRINYY